MKIHRIARPHDLLPGLAAAGMIMRDVRSVASSVASMLLPDHPSLHVAATCCAHGMQQRPARWLSATQRRL